MRAYGFLVAACFVMQAAAGTTSYTGTLASSTDTFTVTLDLASAGSVGFQTYGFGGGTNAASVLIPDGGFDPFVGVFLGTGPTAVFIDGTSDIYPNLTSACGPAGTVDIGGAVCGDVAMSLSLAAGTYTVLLTDANYLLNAINGGTLGDGFTDVTGGVFQTCNTTADGVTCSTRSANWALDVTTPDTTSPVPEPGGLWFLGTGLIILGAAYRRQRFIGPNSN